MMVEKAVDKIAVIGPGMMGHAIAQEFAAAGFEVTLCGRSEKRLDEACTRIDDSLHELAEWGLLSREDVDPALSRIATTTDIEAAGSDADFLVESIVEVLEEKEALFSRLEIPCPS